MSISTLGTLFQFIGGLGMFLYGMELAGRAGGRGRYRDHPE